MSPKDRILVRLVRNQKKLISEHLEAMQRDTHGVEYDRWKREVDGLWKRIFEQINEMNFEPQRSSLQEIKELWTMYVSHYAVKIG